MTNRQIYFTDPSKLELLNNGVSKVSEIGQDDRQIKTLRFELETFVCEKILDTTEPALAL